MSADHLELAAAFPEPSREDWLSAVDKVLRGKPFDKVLVGATADGLDVQPLYTAADVDGDDSPLRPDRDRLARGWDVRQRHDGDDLGARNAAILHDLERGVTSVELAEAASPWTTATLAEALDGVLLDLAPVALTPHHDIAAATALAEVNVEAGAAASARSWLGLDPVGAGARGLAHDEIPDLLDATAAAAAELAHRLPHGRLFTVDTTRHADAGATEAQELAWALATGVASLRALEAAGLEVGRAADTIAFRMAADADQFLTLASVRTLRSLWRRVLDACGLDPDAHPAAIQAVTSRSMYSRRDPWVNMLRATTATFGAAVGGADAITVLPFDAAVGATDAFGRRTARNTQLLLLEESHLARLVDPAAGAWFVESLCGRLAEAAWEEFRAIEADGGMVAAWGTGRIRAAIDTAWEQRDRRLAGRREPITGVSEFPLLDESLLERAPAPAPADPAGLPLRRLAEPFEALRDAADRHLATTGRRPTVFLAALGELAVHTARSTWIANLAAVGGVATVGGDADGSASPLEAEARFADQDSPVAVICSSDAVYAERAAATATALKEAGAVRVVLAGAPGSLRDELDAAGVDEYWHVGVDVVDALSRLHDTLGVS